MAYDANKLLLADLELHDACEIATCVVTHKANSVKVLSEQCFHSLVLTIDGVGEDSLSSLGVHRQEPVH